MKTIRVKVKNKEVMCVPERCFAKRGDSVKWESKDGYVFGVHFGWKSPFKNRSFQAAKKKMKTKAEQVLEDAPFDSYKYTISVFDGRNVLIADPELIIEPQA